MNVINIDVSFEKGTCNVDGIPLVKGDIDSTKLVFKFDRDDGVKEFKMKSPDGQVLYHNKIKNNEIRLYSINKDTGKKETLFYQPGKYMFEILLFKDGELLTSPFSYLEVRENLVEIDNIEYFIEDEHMAVYKNQDLFVISARETLVCPATIVCPTISGEKFLIFNMILPKRLTNIQSFKLEKLKGYIDSNFYDFTELGLISIEKVTDNIIKFEVYLRDSIKLGYVTSVVISECILQFSTDPAKIEESPSCILWFNNVSDVKISYTGEDIIDGAIEVGSKVGIKVHKPKPVIICFSAEGYKDLEVVIDVSTDDIIDGRVDNFDIQMPTLEEGEE